MAPPLTFRQLFGREPAVVAEAPGRANLIGEHTDHSGGYVLPLALPLSTRVELRPRGDRRVEAHSVQLGASAGFTLGERAMPESWIRYVWAATEVAGECISGFEARIDSTVPAGAGLASSAALLVALLRAFRMAFQWTISDQHLARSAHRAETEGVGVPVGCMDPWVASLGRPGAALFLDTTTLRTELIPLPAGFALGVVHSGIEHQLVQGHYRLRREECEAAAAALGVSSLRALSLSDLPRLEGLPPPLDRRARHVLTENARVLEAVAALRAGELARLGSLFDASHRSLRDDFQVSISEVNALVDLACAAPGVLGARMTGGGFGGSVVVLARPEGLRETMEGIAADYRRRVGQQGRVLLPE